jgi:outer membrane protein assembly complex protein YaeT
MRRLVFALTGLAVLFLQTALLSARPDSAGVQMVFQGNVATSEATLREAAEEQLADFELKGLRRADLDDAAFQMESVYRRDGYAFAKVDYETVPTDALTTVSFKIDEGPRVLVDRITISGHQAVDRPAIEKFLRGDRLSVFGETGYPFVRSEVESAVESIRGFYLALGYLDVGIQAPDYTFHHDRARVGIDIRIDEGIRYWVRRMTFTGDLPVEVIPALEDLQRELIKQPYTQRLDLTLQGRAKEIFGNWGYSEAAIEVSGRVAEASGSVDLEAKADSGPLVTIQSIRIQGLERAREEFVLRRLKLMPGDRFSLALQRESSSELFKSGVFSRCDIELEQTAEPGQRVLVVKVEEAPSQEVYLQPGWGSYEQLMVKLGYRHTNLLGTALAWNTGVSGSDKAQGVSSTLTDPWFLDTDLRADLTGFADHREEPAFTRRDYGGSFFLTKDLNPALALSGGYTLRNTGLSNLSATLREEDFDQNYDFTSIKLQVTYDTRNDLFFPTTGQRAFTAVEQADTWMGGDLNFTRLTLGARAYFRMAEATVLGLRYDTGLIIPGRENLTLPPAERFFNGGENTVRSFKESELGPTDGSGKPTGGYGVNVLSVELRQRLIGDFTGSLFFDLGNVSPNRTRFAEGESDYRNRDQIISDTFADFFRGFRPAVGCGLQYQLPVGPVRLDVGFNPDREKSRNEDLYVVHFSIGMAF